MVQEELVVLGALVELAVLGALVVELPELVVELLGLFEGLVEAVEA